MKYWFPIWFSKCASKTWQFGELTGETGKWRNFHFYFHKCEGMKEISKQNDRSVQK